MPGTFSPPPLVSDPDMHHGMCVTHMSWCMPGSLTSGFLWSRRWGKHSRHSRRMRNPQFYVSGKRPMARNSSHHRSKHIPSCITKASRPRGDKQLLEFRKRHIHDTAAHPGPWFNIKMSSYQYRKSHCGDNTDVRSSYPHNGISYTGKIISLYWIRAQIPCISKPWHKTNGVITHPCLKLR